jgi:predicted Zn-dependent protease
VDDLLEQLAEQLIEGMVGEQVVKYLKEKQPTLAINFIWPQVLKDRNNPKLNTLLGVAYWHEGKISDAKLHLQQALKVNPDELMPRYYLALSLAEERKYEDALKELQECLNRGHEDPAVYRGIASLSKKLDDGDSASISIHKQSED